MLWNVARPVKFKHPEPSAPYSSFLGADISGSNCRVRKSERILYFCCGGEFKTIKSIIIGRTEERAMSR